MKTINLESGKGKQAIKNEPQKVAENTNKKEVKKPEAKKPTLAEQIQKYNRMAMIARTRSRFIQAKDQLDEVKTTKQMSIEDFETSENLKLKLVQGYNTELLSVGNEFIINEFKDFMIKKINEKIAEIDLELLK